MALITDFITLINGMENSHIVEVDQLLQETKNVYCYDQLSKLDITGLPLCLVRNPQDKKLYFNLEKNNHVLLVGATGSGKTTGYINIVINILAQLKNNSCLISDPKGELYTLYANRFKDQGYKVVNFNFRNPGKSDYWNPLTKIFRMFQKAHNLPEVIIDNSKSRNKYLYKGVVYTTLKEARIVASNEKNELLLTVENELSAFVANFILEKNFTQPEWILAARKIFVAYLYAMLEDSIPNNRVTTLITEYTFSLKTLMSIHRAITKSENDRYEDGGYFTDRPDSSKAKGLVQSILIDNAAATRRGALFTFEAITEKIKNGALTQLMSANTVELEEIMDQNTVIFIQFSDDRYENYDIIRFLMTDLYSNLIQIADSHGGKLQRPFYYIWDEFGNFPEIQNFSNMMTACRSRNIWLILVVQDYAQLDSKYYHTAPAIKNNANIRIFFGTNDFKTMEFFSDDCLSRTIVSPTSIYTGHQEKMGNISIINQKNVSISDLNTIEEGVCYIKCFRRNPIKSWFERSYKCPEFDYPLANHNEYVPTINVYDSKYDYVYKRKDKNEILFRNLRNLK